MDARAVALSARSRPTRHFLRAARRGSSLHELALHDVLSQRRGALEFGARLLGPAEFSQQIAADGRQQVVRLERWLGDECVHEIEAGCGTERHPHGDRTVQLDHWRWREPRDRVVAVRVMEADIVVDRFEKTS